MQSPWMWTYIHFRQLHQSKSYFTCRDESVTSLIQRTQPQIQDWTSKSAHNQPVTNITSISSNLPAMLSLIHLIVSHYTTHTSVYLSVHDSSPQCILTASDIHFGSFSVTAKKYCNKMLCFLYTDCCPRGQTPRGQRERQRGDGAEPSLILPLQSPDEHPPDYHPPRGPLSSTQQLAVPPLLPIDYSKASAIIGLLWTGRNVL